MIVRGVVMTKCGISLAEYTMKLGPYRYAMRKPTKSTAMTDLVRN